jgi:hypothetical protein
VAQVVELVVVLLQYFLLKQEHRDKVMLAEQTEQFHLHTQQVAVAELAL